jgi:integrase
VFIGLDSIGKDRYVERGVTGSRLEAERELSRVLADVEEGRYSPSAAMTYNHLLDRWLDVKAMSIGPSTLKSNYWIAAHYVRPALGDRKLGKLRPTDLDMLYADLSARGLSLGTVRICHSILRQSPEQACRWSLIVRSPPTTKCSL